MNAEIIDSADSIPTLEKVSKYVDDAVNNLDALKEASEDITIINSEFKENEIKRKANEMLREKNEKARLQSEDIRITEEEEREANELERIKAENNRKVSESNRKVSENTRVTNERAREEAELSRQSIFEENEEIRNSNENLRIASEKERIKLNNKAKTDEVNRKEAETKRVEAEKTRVIAEDERKKAETSRQEAEDIRQNTYTNFNEAEEERRNNEISRQEAEALRTEAEKRRDDLYSQKEEERNAAFLESERTRGTAFNEAQNDRNLTFEESERVREEAFKVSEAARNEAEEGRVAAELLRAEAEKLRVAGEENRNNTFTQSEEERKCVFEEAENARKVAESKRVAAETGRVEAETLRVTAETGRVEAENLRVTAEEERAAAETKREEGFNKFEGKINANTEELKNARSATTGEKFNSLDERIDHEVMRLRVKIEVTMLEQEDKESHIIENTVEGVTSDMVVKGRTLQNLCSSKLVTINVGQVFKNIISPLNLLQGGKTYTIIYNLTKTSSINERCTPYLENASGARIYEQATANYNISTGIKKWTITLSSDFDPTQLCFWVQGHNSDVEIKDFIIIEGDYTNKPIPAYFEGIKSFGEAEGNKISILSHGKNLFDINNIEIKTDSIIKNKNGYILKNYSNNTNKKVKEVFPFLTVGKTYAFSFEFDYKGNSPVGASGTISFYDFTTSSLIKSMHSGDKITVTNNILETHVFLYGVTSGETYISNIQVEEGSKTIYEHYKSYKKDILLQDLGFDEGLRGINDISDELNSLRNVAIKRIGKREYREGDELLENIITDKTNTYYVLEEQIETPLDENINVKTFGERTYVSFENSISGTSSFKAPVDAAATISRLNRENRALEEENKNLRQDFESTTLTLTDSDLELVKQNVDMDFRLMEVEFALDIPQAILSSDIKFKNKKGEVKNMARTPYEMMKIVILSGDYDREDYIHKVGKYYERGRMTKEEHDELMSLMTADEVISK
ncbi:TPA: hypothetical protein LCY67_001000 [Clostridium perfringens]|nr:hypothetical protein [Clostridium perfringens]HBJ6107623.1 hypothetical protein [Clostridium perfringens]